jgi:hypothetical protein
LLDQVRYDLLSVHFHWYEEKPDDVVKGFVEVLVYKLPNHGKKLIFRFDGSAAISDAVRYGFVLHVTMLDRIDHGCDQLPHLLVEELEQVTSQSAAEERVKVQPHSSPFQVIVRLQVVDHQQSELQLQEPSARLQHVWLAVPGDP